MDDVLTQLQGSHNPKPNEWVLSWLKRLPVGSSVLDFASGHGRHALAAAALGMRVTAWDKDAAALDDLASSPGRSFPCPGTVTVEVCDLESDPWPQSGQGFDAVVVSNYLYRPRLALMSALLGPGGVLIYQTFANGHELIGRPRRSDFLLRPGELFDLARVAGLHVLSYEDSVTLRKGEPLETASQSAQPGLVAPTLAARVQRLAALKTEGPAPLPDRLGLWPVNIHG